MTKWSGRTTLYEHIVAMNTDDWKKVPIPENATKAVRKVTVLDGQWTTCPVEVESQIKDLWRERELGNDNYVLKRSISDLIEIEENGTTVRKLIEEDGIPREWKEVPLKTDAIVQYLREQGVGDDEDVWIHWWW